jgi:dihydroflavonol-4-reductase
MPKCVVTGGCGFLGSWMVRQLVEAGREVRVLAVPREPRDNLVGLDVEILEGDVRSRSDLERVMQGVDTVFHAAAIYQDFAPDPTLMYDVNLRGTFHVLEAARRAGVEKVIYTASIVSLGRPQPGQWGDEDMAYEAWDLDFPYSRSKLFSRQIAECFATWDLDVRVVCPGVVMGPSDIRPTPSGNLIIKSMETPGPAVHWDGGASYVDVRDAARAHLLAEEKGRRGERYIATAHNLTNEELVRAILRASGRSRPLVKLPLPVARAVATGLDIAAKRTGTPPLLAREFFEYSLKPSFYRNDKAKKELGATFRPLDETLRDAIAYFRQRGLIQS